MPVNHARGPGSRGGSKGRLGGGQKEGRERWAGQDDRCPFRDKCATELCTSSGAIQTILNGSVHTSVWFKVISAGDGERGHRLAGDPAGDPAPKTRRRHSQPLWRTSETPGVVCTVPTVSVPGGGAGSGTRCPLAPALEKNERRAKAVGRSSIADRGPSLSREGVR